MAIRAKTRRTAARKAAVHPANATDLPLPPARRLWVFARDPLMSTEIKFYDINEVELEVRWEPFLKPGPVGEYLEVIDVDPPSGMVYEPIDLNHPRLLAQSGFKPTEGNPKFHQQMVYAVAMKTISHFESALGRVALWAPRFATINGKRDSRFVRRLRIYPHALREANAYYSPDKRALLFGYFRAAQEAGDNLPGGLVFNCLSHDVVAHETTHALLDGLHPRYKEPNSLDMLAFHEAFADIVALFQHFTIPAVLTEAIRDSDGHAGVSKRLADLAVQFGEAIGAHGALRSGIDRNGEDDAKPALRLSDPAAAEPHVRGQILVAAVFAAFREIYDRRTKRLFRLASNGTGILPAGTIPHDLTHALAEEAAKVADDILHICIRALDYCPPVDLTFGEYLRALVTADRDLFPDDRDGYRVAFISAFRERSIYPADVLNLSVDALTWQKPTLPPGTLAKEICALELIDWTKGSDRHRAFLESNRAAQQVWRIITNGASKDVLKVFGIAKPSRQPVTIDGKKGIVSPIEVHSVRPARRVGRDGDVRTDIIIELTQKWVPEGWEGPPFRGGCTIICNREDGEIRYAIRKRVGNATRTKDEIDFHGALAGDPGHAPAFEGAREPFAMMHRGI